MPLKEGLQGTGNDLVIVGGTHGSSDTTFSRYSLEGGFLGQVPVNFSSYNGGNVGIGNVIATPDGHYVYAPLEATGFVVKIDLSDGAIVARSSWRTRMTSPSPQTAPSMCPTTADRMPGWSR